MTPEQRGELAERLLPHAAALVCLVHGDGDRRDIQQALARLTQVERDALPVVLAALVDPDAEIADLLAFVTWDEYGRPATPVRVSGSVRDLADAVETMPSPQGRAAAIVEDTAELVLQGLPRSAIADRFGVTWNAVQKAHERTGVPLPAIIADELAGAA
ncbi:hypothetical protein ABH930_000275 [Kitasatospora sp. GAS204A]|uniref:hypothetical protein n=1 Tax=unclassified Kitasatospora TaxID=2633591 RepID=UPI00247526B4|nr:hypothetical protein [Kitasatospora sp. GAS204B]MDH6116856.1 hypothetical protein [Kitasatospora sp. GAS204B]